MGQSAGQGDEVSRKARALRGGRNRPGRRRFWRLLTAGLALSAAAAASVAWLAADNRRRIARAERGLAEGDYPGARDALRGGLWLGAGRRDALREEIDRRDLADRFARGRAYRRDGELDFAARCLAAAVALEGGAGQAAEALEQVRVDWTARIRGLLTKAAWEQAGGEAAAAARRFPGEPQIAALGREAAVCAALSRAEAAASRAAYGEAARRAAEALAAAAGGAGELSRRAANQVAGVVEAVLAAASERTKQRKARAAAEAINGAERIAGAAGLGAEFASRIAEARGRLGGRPDPNPDRAALWQAAAQAKAAAEAAREKARTGHADACLPREWAAGEGLLAAAAGTRDQDPNAARRQWSQAAAAFAELCRQTEQARLAASQARDRADEAAVAARQAEAEPHAPRLWKTGGDLREAGTAHFQAHRYEEARTAWSAAAGAYERAGGRAEAKRAFEAARNRQEAALKRKLSFDGPSALAAYGGASWAAIASAVAEGTEAQYRWAARRLPAAAAEAARRWAGERVREYAGRIDAHLARGDVAEARRELVAVRRFAAVHGLAARDPSLRDLGAKVERAEGALLLSRAGALAAAGRFDQARAVLAGAGKVLPDDPRIAAQRAGIDRAEYTRRLAAGRQALEAGRIADALAAARRAASLLPADEGHRRLAGEIERSVVAVPRGLRAKGDFVRTEAEAKRARKWLPENAELKALAAELALLRLRYRPAGRALTGHDGWVYDLAAAPDGERVASGDGSGKVLVWSLRLGAQVARPAPRAGGVTCVSWSPDGGRIATGHLLGSVYLWSGRAPYAEVARLDGHTGMAIGLAFSADGKHLASGGFDKTARVWDASGQRKRPLATLDAHDHWVVSVAFSPDGRLLATGSTRDDRKIRLWDWRAGRVVRTIPADPADAHEHDVHSLAFLRGGRTLLSAGHDKRIRLWEIATGRLERTLAFGGDLAFSEVAVAPDGFRAACACRPGLLRFEVRVIDLVSGKTLQMLAGRHTDFVTAVAFSPDGRRILSGSRDKTLRVWEAQR